MDSRKHVLLADFVTGHDFYNQNARQLKEPTNVGWKFTKMTRMSTFCVIPPSLSLDGAASVLPKIASWTE